MKTQTQGVKQQTRLTVRLTDGTEHSVTVGLDREPRHWKSWLMRSLPYETSFQGATFTREIEWTTN